MFFISEVSKNEKNKRACAKWFIFLFVLEIGIAIFERLTNSLLFSYALFNPEDDNVLVNGIEYFRSNSLLGHPLSNALCVAVVLAFVAVSDLKKYLKYLLILAGFVALLCFNARFAIIISFSFYSLYYLAKNKLKPGSLIALASAVLVIFFLIVNFNLGDRLLIGNLKADDTSILARVDILDMLQRLNSDLLFRGSGLDFVEKSFGILHIENWLLIIIFDLGILVSIYYVYMIFKLPLRSLIRYDFYDKAYIFAVFIIIASSNNSLATGVPVISFMIASSMFLPLNSQKETSYGVSHF
ncbi:MAG: hypothetical protein EOO93_11865 [Pedobacter sp.]|nr:MAG: hypothetical protein EOO93_11865 [Pedobacter sp.]